MPRKGGGKEEGEKLPMPMQNSQKGTEGGGGKKYGRSSFFTYLPEKPSSAEGGGREEIRENFKMAVSRKAFGKRRGKKRGRGGREKEVADCRRPSSKDPQSIIGQMGGGRG